MTKAYLRLIRPAHWLKNVLVLVPVCFAGELLGNDPMVLGAAFLAFSFTASAVYVFNDIQDVERDRNAPPPRCNRPIASGVVSVRQAWIAFAVLVVLSLLSQVLVGSVSGGLLLLFYAVLNIAYSKGLKAVPIVDVAILASGYVFRVLYGGLVCGITISSWLYLTILAASFYMGLGKRRGEMTQLKPGGVSSQQRAVLKFYSYAFLDKMMYLFLALANVFYALWAREAQPGMLLTVPILWLMCMKYALDIEGDDSDGDPMEVILKDRVLIVLSVVFVAAIAAGIYVGLPGGWRVV